MFGDHSNCDCIYLALSVILVGIERRLSYTIKKSCILLLVSNWQKILISLWYWEVKKVHIICTKIERSNMSNWSYVEQYIRWGIPNTGSETIPKDVKIVHFHQCVTELGNRVFEECNELR